MYCPCVNIIKPAHTVLIMIMTGTGCIVSVSAHTIYIVVRQVVDLLYLCEHHQTCTNSIHHGKTDSGCTVSVSTSSNLHTQYTSWQDRFWRYCLYVNIIKPAHTVLIIVRQILEVLSLHQHHQTCTHSIHHGKTGTGCIVYASPGHISSAEVP